jgi:hypothetical protein
MSVRTSVYIDEATLTLLQSSVPAVSFEAMPAGLSFEQLARLLRETSEGIEALGSTPSPGRRDFSKEVSRALSKFFSLVTLLRSLQGKVPPALGYPLDPSLPGRL